MSSWFVGYVVLVRCHVISYIAKEWLSETQVLRNPTRRWALCFAYFVVCVGVGWRCPAAIEIFRRVRSVSDSRLEIVGEFEISHVDGARNCSTSTSLKCNIHRFAVDVHLK